MAYDNTNRGVLGRNKNRESENYPEYTGSINVDGVDYWLNGWVKENKKDGSKFFSLSVKRKESKQGGQPSSHQSNDSSSEEVPF